MSNSLALAAVTSTLRHVLHEALGEAEPEPVGGADVTTYRPAQLADADTVGAAASGINVFLHTVTPNHAWNLTDLPTRRHDGSLAQRPLAALDLQYLITCYGDDEALVPQRLLGRAVLALAVTPVFTRDVVAAAMAKYGIDATGFLTRADLADQTDLIKISPTPMSVEETSKLWGILGTPYLLSLSYTATVVLLEAAVQVRTALPVLTRSIDIDVARQPRLSEVTAGPGVAVTTGSSLVLTGSSLLGPLTRITFSGRDVEPTPTSTRSRLDVTVPGAVPAGVHAVMVVHRSPGDPVAGTPSKVLGTSNAMPVVVHPRVTNIAGDADNITVTVQPQLIAGQRAVVSFGRLSGGDPADPAQVSQAFPRVSADDAPMSVLVVEVDALTTGTWLVRVEVDGVESQPTLVDRVYREPSVTVP